MFDSANTNKTGQNQIETRNKQKSTSKKNRSYLGYEISGDRDNCQLNTNTLYRT